MQRLVVIVSELERLKQKDCHKYKAGRQTGRQVDRQTTGREGGNKGRKETLILN